jgi:hypothetical protein
MCAVTPADLATRRAMRVAAGRFIWPPTRVNNSGPEIRSPAARSTAFATRGARGITASLEPLPTTVTIRWPRWAERSSMLIEQASGDAQAEQAAQGWVDAPGGGRLGDKGGQFHAVQRGRLGDHLRPSHVLGWGVLDQPVEHAGAVLAGHGG